jgi:hypothetical protein
VGVHPASPTNSLIIRYRIDRGMVQTIAGREIRNDFERNVQYFAVVFPSFPAGDLVEYAPVLGCGGRQVPAPHIADRFRSTFRLEPKPSISPGVRLGKLALRLG